MVWYGAQENRIAHIYLLLVQLNRSLMSRSLTFFVCAWTWWYRLSDTTTSYWLLKLCVALFQVSQMQNVQKRKKSGKTVITSPGKDIMKIFIKWRGKSDAPQLNVSRNTDWRNVRHLRSVFSLFFSLASCRAKQFTLSFFEVHLTNCVYVCVFVSEWFLSLARTTNSSIIVW